MHLNLQHPVSYHTKHCPSAASFEIETDKTVAQQGTITFIDLRLHAKVHMHVHVNANWQII